MSPSPGSGDDSASQSRGPARLSSGALSRLPANAGRNSLTVVVPLILAVFLTPYMAARLGLEMFGLYILASSVVGLGAVADLGLSTAGVKLLAEDVFRKDEQRISLLLDSLLALRLPMSVVLSAGGTVLAPGIAVHWLGLRAEAMDDAVFVLRVASMNLAVAMIGGSLASVPRALSRYELVAWVSVGSAVLSAALVVVALSMGLGVRAVVVAEFAVVCLQGAGFILVARWLLPFWHPRVRIDREPAIRLLSFGASVSLGPVAAALLIHVPRVLLARILGMAIIPYYSVPWNLTARLTQLTHAATETLLPVASELTAERDARMLRELYANAFLAILVLGTSVMLPVVIVAPDFLGIWMGWPFSAESALILRVFAVAAVGQSLAAVSYFLLCGIGRPGRTNLLTVVGAGLSAALAGILAAGVGIEGAAVGVLVGIGFQVVTLTSLGCRALGLPTADLVRRTLLPFGAASATLATAGACGFLLPPGWVRFLLLGPAAAMTFHGLLVFLGFYRGDGRAIIQVARRSLGRVARAASRSGA